MIVLDEGTPLDITIAASRDGEVDLDISLEIAEIDIKEKNHRLAARIGSRRVGVIDTKPLDKPFTVTMRKDPVTPTNTTLPRSRFPESAKLASPRSESSKRPVRQPWRVRKTCLAVKPSVPVGSLSGLAAPRNTCS